MGKRISAALSRAKARVPEQVPNGVKSRQSQENKRAQIKGPKNANDHERQARVHPALPCH
jgi:hypothetical protein